MAEVGDKSFAKELVNSMETLVDQTVGNASTINRYQAKVVSVDTTNHTASVYIGGVTTGATSDGIRVRGLQFPSVNDLVMVCIDGEERWIESVVRPVGTGAYPSITLDWANNEIDLVGTVVGGGVVTETGTQTLTNKTLTAPKISSISNTGTLTLPTSTDTLVGKATTDTLTNKTLSNPAFSYTTTPTVTLTGAVTGTGSLALGNAGALSIATSLPSGMTFDITGDVTGTAITLGSGSNSFTAVVGDNTHAHDGTTISGIALGTDTTGNYVNNVTAGTGVTVSGTAGEGWSPTIAIGQAVGTTSNVTFNNLVANGNVTLGSATADILKLQNLFQTTTITNSYSAIRIYNAASASAWRMFVDSSSERYKTNILRIEDNDSILDLQSISYHDKVDLAENGEESARQYGFLAEELAENSETIAFVNHDTEGRPDSIQYDRLVVPLHSAMRKMRNRINELEARLAALEAR